jgi:hypothetical protein
MTDEQPDITPAPEATPSPAPEPVAAVPDPSTPSTSSDSSAAASGEQLVSDFKKDELQTAAAVVGADVPSSATKADLADAIVAQQAPVQPVVVDLATKRTDDDPILGSWVDVVSGEYQGRFGSYVATVTHDASTGYPEQVIVRTRDADNLLIEVAYSDLRPSARNGGR